MENHPEKITNDRIILLVHGLSGCYQSSYAVRLNRKFVEAGYRVIRMNLRGCGPGWKQAKKPSNAGRSDDLRATLEWLKLNFPSSPVTAIAFSLGANILLKMVGEDGTKPSGLLDRFTAVSPPLDLQKSIDCMDRRENLIYSRYFTFQLKKDIVRLQKYFPELRDFDVSHCKSVHDLDKLYTAPLSGYSSAAEYYRICSSKNFIADIKTPGLIIGAFDDPIIDGREYRSLKKHDFLQYLLLEKGGHVAFIEQPLSRKPFRWMDECIFLYEKNCEKSFC